MKKSYLFLTGLVAIIAVVGLYNSIDTEQNYVPRADLIIAEEANGALEHYNLLRANPVTGEIDKNLVRKVREGMKKLTKTNANKSQDYIWNSQGPDNIGGRTRALHVYEDNPNIIIAGGVSWRVVAINQCWWVLE